MWLVAVVMDSKDFDQAWTELIGEREYAELAGSRKASGHKYI